MRSSQDIFDRRENSSCLSPVDVAESDGNEPVRVSLFNGDQADLLLAAAPEVLVQKSAFPFRTPIGQASSQFTSYIPRHLHVISTIRKEMPSA